MKALSVTVCCAALVALLAAPAAANDVTGACWATWTQDFPDEPDDIEKGVAVCADFVTSTQCSDLDDPGEGIYFNFEPGTLCPDTEFKHDWDGACTFTEEDAPVCILVSVEPADSPEYDSEFFCEWELGIVGEWQGDDSVCPAVPTLPDMGLSLLAIVVAGGGLLFVLLRRRLAVR